MDLRQLRYFVAVAEELSFTAAAARLNISQPPLSMQIKALEDGLGTLLFDRSRRSIALTEAGKVLLEHARQNLSHLAYAVDLTQRAGRGEAGLLRVAFTGSVPLVASFANLVKRFRSEWPLARLEIVHMATGRQLQALAERRIDVGLLRPSHLFRAPSHLKLDVFWKDELRVVLPSGHALAARKGRIPVGALAGEPFILFPRGIGCGLYDHVMGLCNSAGFVPQVVQEAQEGPTIVGLVAAGVGLSLLPDAYAKVNAGGVAYARLEAASAASQLYTAYRADDRSPLLRRFVRLARDAADAQRSREPA